MQLKAREVLFRCEQTPEMDLDRFSAVNCDLAGLKLVPKC